LSSVTLVKINVPECDNQVNAKFSHFNYLTRIFENQKLESLVAHLSINDPRNLITYYFCNTSNLTLMLSEADKLTTAAGGSFRIEPISGRIYLASKLNRKLIKEYTVQICALFNESRLQDTAFLRIKVEDSNNHPPVFKLIESPASLTSAYTIELDLKRAYIKQDAQRPVKLFQLQTIDLDGGINGQVRLSIDASNSHLFYINETDSCLYMNYFDNQTYLNELFTVGVDPSLDRVHYLAINAYDKGVPTLKSPQLDVYIRLLDSWLTYETNIFVVNASVNTVYKTKLVNLNQQFSSVILKHMLLSSLKDECALDSLLVYDQSQGIVYSAWRQNQTTFRRLKVCIYELKYISTESDLILARIKLNLFNEQDADYMKKTIQPINTSIDLFLSEHAPVGSVMFDLRKLVKTDVRWVEISTYEYDIEWHPFKLDSSSNSISIVQNLSEFYLNHTRYKLKPIEMKFQCSVATKILQNNNANEEEQILNLRVFLIPYFIINNLKFSKLIYHFELNNSEQINLNNIEEWQNVGELKLTLETSLYGHLRVDLSAHLFIDSCSIIDVVCLQQIEDTSINSKIIHKNESNPIDSFKLAVHSSQTRINLLWKKNSLALFSRCLCAELRVETIVKTVSDSEQRSIYAVIGLSRVLGQHQMPLFFINHTTNDFDVYNLTLSMNDQPWPKLISSSLLSRRSNALFFSINFYDLIGYEQNKMANKTFNINYIGFKQAIPMLRSSWFNINDKKECLIKDYYLNTVNGLLIINLSNDWQTIINVQKFVRLSFSALISQHRDDYQLDIIKEIYLNLFILGSEYHTNQARIGFFASNLIESEPKFQSTRTLFIDLPSHVFETTIFNTSTPNEQSELRFELASQANERIQFTLDYSGRLTAQLDASLLMCTSSFIYHQEFLSLKICSSLSNNYAKIAQMCSAEPAKLFSEELCDFAMLRIKLKVCLPSLSLLMDDVKVVQEPNENQIARAEQLLFNINKRFILDFYFSRQMLVENITYDGGSFMLRHNSPRYKCELWQLADKEFADRDVIDISDDCRVLLKFNTFMITKLLENNNQATKSLVVDYITSISRVEVRMYERESQNEPSVFYSFKVNFYELNTTNFRADSNQFVIIKFAYRREALISSDKRKQQRLLADLVNKVLRLKAGSILVDYKPAQHDSNEHQLLTRSLVADSNYFTSMLNKLNELKESVLSELDIDLLRITKPLFVNENGHLPVENRFYVAYNRKRVLESPDYIMNLPVRENLKSASLEEAPQQAAFERVFEFDRLYHIVYKNIIITNKEISIQLSFSANSSCWPVLFLLVLDKSHISARIINNLLIITHTLDTIGQDWEIKIEKRIEAFQWYQLKLKLNKKVRKVEIILFRKYAQYFLNCSL
jgi:hypothetical protein